MILLGGHLVPFPRHAVSVEVVEELVAVALRHELRLALRCNHAIVVRAALLRLVQKARSLDLGPQLRPILGPMLAQSTLPRALNRRGVLLDEVLGVRSHHGIWSALLFPRTARQEVHDMLLLASALRIVEYGQVFHNWTLP